ncbi:MAG: hypothetical protein HQK50_05915 [Oligoflexia bacterium]|nr:hypothetical protein [Oligoflexia bacterium]MBF0365086.1 hypothetical protein [Oligoflexia bacterium]
MRLSRFLVTTSLLSLALFLGSCASFKAQRVDAKKSDEKALEITDKWVSMDTTNAVSDIMKQMQNHKGLRSFLAKSGKPPKIFIGEIKNLTAEAYFPIDDLNEEFLQEVSNSGDFTLVDNAARNAILKEITYQNDGMVDPSTAKSIGKQTGADLMFFGSIIMKPESRDGKTIKQYSVNIRITNIESAEEVMRARTKVDKYSEQSGSGW